MQGYYYQFPLIFRTVNMSLRWYNLFVLGLLLYPGCICNGEEESPPEVKITQGTLRGKYRETVNKRKIYSFEGIPFAKPPVGSLRFREPVPSGPWEGIYDATKLPPICIQGAIILNVGQVNGTEDCLYLNVYTPKLPSSDQTKLLDVIAFIHGGAYMVGKSWDCGPSMLLDRDVVFVTFNYRLGPIGFLSTEDSVVPGNNGLKDQALALKWIQQNIAAFGGDPKKVTISGISAGGSSCSYQLLSPYSKGLFKGAICLSGVATNSWSLAESPKEKAMAIAASNNCPTNDTFTMVECLRGIPAEKIAGMVGKFMHKMSYPFAPFAPVIEPNHENAFISDSPLNIIKNKRGSDVPVIFSFVQDEGALFLGIPGYLNDFQYEWEDSLHHLLDYNFTLDPQKRPEVSQKIKEYYKINQHPHDTSRFVQIFGDRYFVAGISKIAKVSAAHYNSPVYVYRFSYKGKLSLLTVMNLKNEDLEKNPTHGDDALYTLGFGMTPLPIVNSSDRDLAKKMLDIWVSFAANGKLEGDWEPVQKHLPNITFTDIRGPNDFKITVEEELGEESFWDSLPINGNIDSLNLKHQEL